MRYCAYTGWWAAILELPQKLTQSPELFACLDSCEQSGRMGNYALEEAVLGATAAGFQGSLLAMGVGRSG